MTWIDKIRLGLVPGKVRTLYTLLLLEHRWATEYRSTEVRNMAFYASGRAGAYLFTMVAMEDRWPVLARLRRYVEKTRSR